MAKKRGRKKKVVEPVNKHELPSGFWRQVTAVLMIVLSIFFVFTWMGKGGEALKAINDFSTSVFGWTTYLIPVILTYLAVLIFRAEDNRVDLSVWIASVLMIFWFSGIFGVAFSGQVPNKGGGYIGGGMDSVVVDAIGKPLSFIAYAVMIIITACFMYAETPAALIAKITACFKTKQVEDEGEGEGEEEPPRRRRKSIATETGNITINAAGDEPEPEPEEKPRRGILNIRQRKDEKPPTDDESTEEKKAAPVPTINYSGKWKYPSKDLLNKKQVRADAGDIPHNAETIRDTLAQFGIDVAIDQANVGPRVTQYTFAPPAGIKLNKITELDKNLSLSLASDKIRIEAPIPGTRSVGVEIPNERPESVNLYSLLVSDEWKKMITDKPLSFAVGKDISGKTVVGNLAKMPHLLIAGTTGSGKSVMTNTMITSMLYHNSPDDLRLIIVDPKQVEMAAYSSIPHLLAPIITDVAQALSALKWSVAEMEKRYSMMADERVKNIVDYNEKMAHLAQEAKENGVEWTDEQKEMYRKLPYIVVIVDEMADLMMMAGKELEMLIVRIAQKGRASGIHLVLATQRPEVKVVTGLIKANIPGRIAFAVNNSVDSRVMLDMGGAEKLLGSGDMLFLTTEMMGKPKRVQGAFVSDSEIAKVTDFLRSQGEENYNPEVTSQQVQIKGMGGDSGNGGINVGGNGDLVRDAAEMIVTDRRVSTSYLQRKFGIGYSKAAAIIDELEERGVVGPAPGGNKAREILVASVDDLKLLFE